MFNAFIKQLSQSSPVSVVVISVAVMLMSGFLATRFTKLFRLPNVTAYILTGMVLGPFCFNLVPSTIVVGTEFISDVALAFIAFSSGEFFKFSFLKRNGGKLMIITLLESLMASLLVFILTFCVLHLSLAFSIILAALASATAPASTLMTIRQTGASGDYVDTLLSVVALDDIVSLIAFSVAVSVSVASMGGNVTTMLVLKPLVLNLVMIGAGVLMGFALRMLVTSRRSTDNRLIISVALLFALCGIGAALEISPLLACMTMGMVYTNLAEDGTLFRQINYFSPPILLLFFVRSGLQFRLDVLFGNSHASVGAPILLTGVLYFIVRIVGKYAGAWLGCLLAKKDRPVRNYLGLALIPQAGVAIGLAALGARTIGGETGEILQTLILSSSILYELIGPASAKLGLYLSGSYGPNKEVFPEDVVVVQEDTEPSQTLRERMLAIQASLLGKEAPKQPISTASAAGPSYSFYGSAPDAENDEYYSILDYMRRNGKFINRR